MRRPTDDTACRVLVLETKIQAIELYSVAAGEGLLRAMFLLPHEEVRCGLDCIIQLLNELSFEECRAYDSLAGLLKQVPEAETRRAVELAVSMESTFLDLPRHLLADTIGKFVDGLASVGKTNHRMDPLREAYFLFLDRIHQLVFFVINERHEKDRRRKNDLHIISNGKGVAPTKPRNVLTRTATHLRLVR